jgi:hypothetical protein
MRPGLRRRTADRVCRSLAALLPSELRPWGDAVRAELPYIENDSAALRHAWSGMSALVPRALAVHLGHPLTARPPRRTPSSRSTEMAHDPAPAFQPRRLAALCGAGAVLAGLAYLWIAGAPRHYLAMNALALPIGFVLMAMLDRIGGRFRGWAGVAALGAAGAILLTALLGQSLEGAVRWARIGGIAIQPSLILLPLLVLAFAQARSWTAAAGIGIAALALALQPDRGMAGALAAGMLALGALDPGRKTAAAAAAAVAGFAATLILPDALPATPFVDQVFSTSFEAGAAAGLLVLGGALLLLVPAAAGWVRDREGRALHAAHGAVWLAILLAAALGNYPTPLVGYGGSAILGYFLAIAALPRIAGGSRADASDETGAAEAAPSGAASMRRAAPLPVS